MSKGNKSSGLQLQKGEQLTSTGWLVWLLCLVIAAGGTMTFLAWANADFDWQPPRIDALFSED